MEALLGFSNSARHGKYCKTNRLEEVKTDGKYRKFDKIFNGNENDTSFLLIFTCSPSSLKNTSTMLENSAV